MSDPMDPAEDDGSMPNTLVEPFLMGTLTEVKRLRDGLRLLAKYGCQHVERSRGGLTCVELGTRTADAPADVDRMCAACVARVLLDGAHVPTVDDPRPPVAPGPETERRPMPPNPTDPLAAELDALRAVHRDAAVLCDGDLDDSRVLGAFVEDLRNSVDRANTARGLR